MKTITRLFIVTVLGVGFKLAMQKVTESSFELAVESTGGTCKSGAEGNPGTCGE